MKGVKIVKYTLFIQFPVPSELYFVAFFAW